MTYEELNNLFCDGEDAYLDSKDYLSAFNCFSQVLTESMKNTDNPDMCKLALESYNYIGSLYFCDTEVVWEEASYLLEQYRAQINKIQQ